MDRVRAFALLAGLSAGLAGFLAPPLSAQSENIGSVDFPTSATGQAQQHFLRGVAILHSFGWNEAIEQFQAAQALDADFAMAYWGESLAYNHPLQSQMNPEMPRQVLQRLGPTPEARRAKAPTDREKGFLGAVEVLWGEGDHEVRRVGYMEAMKELHEAYPDDDEVAAFYSLSLLSASAAVGDLTGRLNVRAGDISLRLFEALPNHPGAAHYTIHAFDDPIHAPLGLEAAEAFAEIAPAVSHARHMPTHIFIQHGMWDRVSEHNQSAYDAARELWQPGESMGDATHALDWGQYGDLQLGDYEKARLWIQRIESMAGGGFLESGPRAESGDARARGAVALLQSRYTIETEEWKVLPVTEDSRPDELLATGLSAAHLGDEAALREAEALLRRMAEGSANENTKLMSLEVSALMHAGMGHPDVTTRLMDEAQALDESMAPPRGAASPIKPVHELYGEILLDLGRPADAIARFDESLLRMPRRPRSLLGLARAHAAVGNGEEAAEAYRTLTEVWAGRDSFEGMQEARRFLAGSTDRSR